MQLKSRFQFWSVLPVVGQSWDRDRYQRPRLEQRSIIQRELARETDSKAPKLKSQFRNRNSLGLTPTISRQLVSTRGIGLGFGGANIGKTLVSS